VLPAPWVSASVRSNSCSEWRHTAREEVAEVRSGGCKVALKTSWQRWLFTATAAFSPDGTTSGRATRANVKMVALTHVTSRAGTDDYSSWVAEVRKRFSGRVVVAKDLGEY